MTGVECLSPSTPGNILLYVSTWSRGNQNMGLWESEHGVVGIKTWDVGIKTWIMGIRTLGCGNQNMDHGNQNMGCGNETKQPGMKTWESDRTVIGME